MLIDHRRYVTQSFRERERERLWPRVWLLAAHSSELPGSGSYATLELGAESFLLTRGPEGVRAFHNVCLHRGTLLCDQRRGRADALRCPYHGWRYDLAGRLLGGHGAEELAAGGAGLAEAACAERGGFVWVRAAADGPSLDEFLGPLLAPLEALSLGAMVLTGDRTHPLACNWKLSSDIHNEGLHLPTLHPELCELVDLEAVRWEALGLHASFTIPLGVPSSGPLAGRVGPRLRGFLQELGVDARALEAGAAPLGDAVREAMRAAFRARAAAQGVELGALDPADKVQLYVFPNVQLNVTGPALELYRHRPHPSDPLACLFDEQRFERRPAGAPAPPVRHEIADAARLDPRSAMGQDLAVAPRVQRGMLSSGLAGLRLGPLEGAIAHMHEGITSFVGEGS